MKKSLLLIYFVCLTASFSLKANCPQFDTALELALKRVTSRELETSKAFNSAAKWGGPEASAYKTKYTSRQYQEFDNRDYLKYSDADKLNKSDNILYFDVENAAQKKLNDSVIGDKNMVDAVNNAFISKFNTNLAADPVLAKALGGSYQDYKSLRLRLVPKSKEESLLLEARLNDVYKKTNKEFVSEFEKSGLTKLISPRTDEAVDVSSWFLSGTGGTSLEANMAARAARQSGFNSGSAVTMSFAKQVDNLHSDVLAIEEIRNVLAADSVLTRNAIMIKRGSQDVLPSKDMIAILRKIKLADCESELEFVNKIRSKTKDIFGVELSDDQVKNLTKYFEKVDSLSPPLFQRSRKTINLEEAKEGIVSVDFTGVGVDNAYEQMKGLSLVNYAQKDKQLLLKDAFSNVQKHVDFVTEDMNLAKRAFSKAASDSRDINGSYPLFSGDDGILMPKTAWNEERKIQSLKALSETADPSKFRVTFMKTEFPNGASVPAAERSTRIVRAEGIEKSLREIVTGHGKIATDRAKQMIFAIDTTPLETGAKYKLYMGGLKPTVAERKIIEEAFMKGIPMKSGEEASGVLAIYEP